MRLALKEFFDQLANARDAGGTADQDSFVDLSGGQAGVLHRLAHRSDGAVDHRLDQLLKLLRA